MHENDVIKYTAWAAVLYRTTAKQTVWNKLLYENLVLCFLSYEFKIISNE
jgi:hypothetical protein